MYKRQVDGPVVESNPEPEVEGLDAPVEVVDDVAPVTEDPKPNATAKKRATAKKAAAEKPVEKSSVQTSWYVSPSQTEG